MSRHYILLLMAALMFAACEKEQVPLSQGDSYISFYDEDGLYRMDVQTLETNFYYDDESKTRDTVWIKLVTKGPVLEKDCKVKLRAYSNTTSSSLSTLPDAESGVHYVPFDSEEMQSLLVFHAGQMYDSIPVILLRDASIKTEGRRLTLRLEDSEDVKSADKWPDDDIEHIFVTIYTADCLSQPTNWGFNFFLGTYGQVKHDFIIRQSGKRWDTEFIETIEDDTNMQTFYLYKFRNALIQENAERNAQGLPVLMEANGTYVTF